MGLRSVRPALVFAAACLALAAYLVYAGYQQRNTVKIIWAASFFSMALVAVLPSIRNGLLVLSSVLLSLALMESAIGFWNDFHNQEPAAYYDPGSAYPIRGYFGLSEYGLQPNPGVYTVKRWTTRNELIYEVTYTIGQDGFRETPQRNEDHSEKINVFGCSFTFGEGLNDDETMAAYFAKESAATRTKNFGIHGWGVHQALAVLESRRDTSGQINFLLTAPWHADRSACAANYSLGSPKYRLNGQGEVARTGYCRSAGWIERSPKAIRAMITKSNISTVVIDSLLVIKNQDEQIDLYLALIRRIHALSKERGQRLVVGYIKADENWFVGRYDNRKVMDALRASGVELIDMTLAPRNEDLPREFHIHDLDEHPSARANQARARLLLDYLKNRPGT